LKDKQAEIVKLLPPIPARPPKEILEKLKFFKKGNKSVENVKSNRLLENVKLNSKLSYTQASSSNISKILKIKNNFPNLLTKKIENVHKMINDSSKMKPRINITIKGPSKTYSKISS